MSKTRALPPDIYQRYATAVECVEALRADGGRLTVFEAGGAPGHLAEFLPDDELRIVDTLPAEGAITGYEQTDLFEADLPERGYDAVLALDVLEHIPPGRREAFLQRLWGASGRMLILAAPFDDPRTVEAEAILRDYITQTSGYEHAMLTEHAEHGLPELEATRQVLEGQGATVVAIPQGPLYRWLAMMVLTFYLDREPKRPALEERINRYYNEFVYPLDRALPAYRHHLVALREGEGAAAERMQAMAQPVADGGEPRELSTATALIELIRLELLSEKQREIAGLENELSVAREELAALKELNARLGDFHARTTATLPYKLYAALKPLLKRIRGAS